MGINPNENYILKGNLQSNFIKRLFNKVKKYWNKLTVNTWLDKKDIVCGQWNIIQSHREDNADICANFDGPECIMLWNKSKQIMYAITYLWNQNKLHL